MRHIQNQIFSLLVFLFSTSIVGCSDSNNLSGAQTGKNKTIIHLIKDASWASVLDDDGIKSIVSEQRIPRGSGVDVYGVDFKFNKKGTTFYDIFIDGMFEKEGTVIHVDVTDMKGNATNLYIRRTAQGHQVGYYRKR